MDSQTVEIIKQIIKNRKDICSKNLYSGMPNFDTQGLDLAIMSLNLVLGDIDDAVKKYIEVGQ